MKNVNSKSRINSRAIFIRVPIIANEQFRETPSRQNVNKRVRQIKYVRKAKFILISEIILQFQNDSAF